MALCNPEERPRRDERLGHGHLPWPKVPALTVSFDAQVDLCEKVYLGIFTVELLTKVLAYGFLWHPEAYLRDAWCQLDFVVVTLAWRRVDTPSIHSAMIAPATHPVAPPACSMGGCRANPPVQAAVTASWNAAARARLRLHTIESS